MTNHDAMKAFFEPKVKELAGDILNFNFSPESPDNFSFVTNYSDRVRKKYVRVGAEKEYGFSIIIIKAYSSGADDLNLEAMNFTQAFMDWIDEQDNLKKYPVFPDNCQVKKMETLQNMPNLAGVNTEEGLARYMIQCRLIYFEREEKR